jgi:hypothetical protein
MDFRPAINHNWGAALWGKRRRSSQDVPRFCGFHTDGKAA